MVSEFQAIEKEEYFSRKLYFVKLKNCETYILQLISGRAYFNRILI